jgi:hypothetical protein
MQLPDTNKVGIVKTPKEFSDALTVDLTDEQITQALKTLLPITRKWQDRFRAKFNVDNFRIEEAMKMIDQFEDELKYELATKCHLLARVDVEPVFNGESPTIEILGALPSHSSSIYGMDHEKKTYEAVKAKELNKDFLGIDKIGG